jgi:hypothetical protein
MNTLDRISRLLAHCGLSPLECCDWSELGMPRSDRPWLHGVLDAIDTVMNVDTTDGLEQNFFGGRPRRQLGARVALLEELREKELAERGRGAPEAAPA